MHRNKKRGSLLNSIMGRHNSTKKERRGVYFSFPETMASKPSTRELLKSEANLSPTYQWKRSANEDYHSHSPVFTVHSSNVSLLIEKEAEFRKNGVIVHESKDETLFTNFKRLQRQVLVQAIVRERASSLPTTSWREDLITSPHAHINKYRAKRNILPLIRETRLDELASKQANRIVTHAKKEHSDINNLISYIWNPNTTPFRIIGENICGGKSIDAIFKKMIIDPKYEADRNNMYDRRFSSFGVGVATNSKGKVYICQIYKG